MGDTGFADTQLTSDDYDTELSDDYDSGYESSTYELSAQEQWEESVRQINGLFTYILFPLIGKVIGRKFSHVIWRHIANWSYE